VPRIWLQEGLTLKTFFTDLLKDIWKLLKWIKGLYRKELVVGSVLILALAPEPHHVKAEVPPAPTYIKPIKHLQPVPAISVAVPVEAVPATEPAPVAPPEPAYVPAPVAAPVVGVSGCGDSMYKQFIYQHESGCRTDAVNPIGACGLGQALPCSKMGCSLSDWACQDTFFTNYANATYGGWAGAYAFWLAHSWW
jgi:hypothetical protein